MGKAGQIAALILLLGLVCGAVVVDCHGDCGDGNDTRACCHACTHAVLSGVFAVGFDGDPEVCWFPNGASAGLLSPRDVFQPPELEV